MLIRTALALARSYISSLLPQLFSSFLNTPCTRPNLHAPAICYNMQSPTRARKQNSDLPSFMRRPPKPDGVKNITNAPIHKLSLRELEERYKRNARTLAET